MTRLEQVSSIADLRAALAPLAGATGRPVLVLVGGAGGMDAEQEGAVRGVLADHVVPVLASTGAVVVDGGTDSGVMRAMGAAHHAAGGTFPLVGVVARGTVTLPGDGAGAPDAAAVDPHHDLVLVVPGETWGDESRWLDEAATALAQRRPSVTLVINGGPVALDDVELSLARGRPVVVLAGTGRLADDVATAGDGSTEAVRKVAGSPLTQLVRLGDDDAAVGAVLRGALTRPEAW
ncbi:hypothetical protein [Georgenia daeguensis]|uniref:LSDAT prokaryote domain-containing protein n=1 Tax=Georgenia daeguensis TaxID=908355 RepID=A0ABP8EUI3_9MICO